MKYDALVVGSGIGGMESALKLGDMGFRVLVVEKEASVGGKMILLSKVFPTLDCASCISTPKMAATIHHPNVTVLTYTQVQSIRRDQGGRFHAKIHQKPRYVDTAACTGCQQCEMSCTVAVPDQFNSDLVSRRAAYSAFPQAVPKKAVIERAGTSPCTFTCPAGIKAHGYVSLVRSGEYEKAFDLILETTPLVGSLGRACYAPCEGECTRGRVEGAVPIRRLKRFVADTHYAQTDNGETRDAAGRDPAIGPETANGRRVAVVGSGPAGLTAAWQLARQGYRVKIFESAPKAGGMLRLGIPAYRLPNQVVDDDVANLTAVGVEIETGHRVDDLTELRTSGFEAVLVATGTHTSMKLRVPGEELPGVQSALTFLRAVKLGEPTDLRDRNVVVIGGGNVAIDAARSARRLGAAGVHLVSLESRGQLPAYSWEVDEALTEGITLHDSWGARQFVAAAGPAGESRVAGVELRRCTAVFDSDGRFSPQYDEAATKTLPCETVIVAAGMGADTASFTPLLELNRNRTIHADPGTLQTQVPYIFAAGDTVTGPSMITAAVGQGRRAAFMIDRWLREQDLDVAEFETMLPMIAQSEVLARQDAYDRREAVTPHLIADLEPAGFAELEPPMSPEEARYSAARCLDCGVCSECHECVNVCPADAIHLDMQPTDLDVEVSAVVVATGFSLFPADLKPQYGYGKFANVITGMQMDRLLAPTRPYNTVLRPGDGKVPERIGYVMCTGSRDQTVGNPLCSKVCCMYSIKQNQLIMGALPLADVTVHYIDIRAVGKGYDEFYEQARGMGANYVRGRVARIEEKADGDLIVHYEDVDTGELATAEYDLVVLAVGIRPNPEAARLFTDSTLALDDYLYVEETSEDLNPGATSIPGVFVSGAASGPKDIPESILHAGAAVAQAAAYLEMAKVSA